MFVCLEMPFIPSASYCLPSLHTPFNDLPGEKDAAAWLVWEGGGGENVIHGGGGEGHLSGAAAAAGTRWGRGSGRGDSHLYLFVAKKKRAFFLAGGQE